MYKWKEELSKDCYSGFNFLFCAAYKEYSVSPDIYFKDLYQLSLNSSTNGFLYEWTIWIRYDLMQHFAFDLDGVICIDPPDDIDKEAYENYIKNPIPFHIPLVKPDGVGTTIITYRINAYRDITSQFLSRVGVTGNLLMVNANSREERNAMITPWDYKASIYGNRQDLILYIESNDYEAQMIHQITKKPVLCVSTNKLYQAED